MKTPNFLTILAILAAALLPFACSTKKTPPTPPQTSSQTQTPNANYTQPEIPRPKANASTQNASTQNASTQNASTQNASTQNASTQNTTPCLQTRAFFQNNPTPNPHLNLPAPCFTPKEAILWLETLYAYTPNADAAHAVFNLISHTNGKSPDDSGYTIALTHAGEKQTSCPWNLATRYFVSCSGKTTNINTQKILSESFNTPVYIANIGNQYGKVMITFNADDKKIIVNFIDGNHPGFEIPIPKSKSFPEIRNLGSFLSPLRYASFDDVNFDGYTDILIPQTPPPNATMDAWIFKPSPSRFELASGYRAITNPMPVPQNKIIQSQKTDQAQIHTTQSFFYDESQNAFLPTTSNTK